MGQRIRRLRLDRGMSQRELAEPGVSYAYLSRIEAGQRAPSLKALRIVARKLGVTVEHLETGSPVSIANVRELRALEAELRLRLDEDPSGAERIFRELVDAARAEGEVTLEVRARAGVGLALARRGELREAVFHLELALSSDSVSPLGRPDVYETLSRCYLASSAPHAAVKLLEECIREVDKDERHATAQMCASSPIRMKPCTALTRSIRTCGPRWARSAKRIGAGRSSRPIR